LLSTKKRPAKASLIFAAKGGSLRLSFNSLRINFSFHVYFCETKKAFTLVKAFSLVRSEGGNRTPVRQRRIWIHAILSKWI